jgi:hypothetical protein
MDLININKCEPHGATQQAIAETPAKWSAYQIPSELFVVVMYKV